VITCLPLAFRTCRWGVSAAADLRRACPPQIGASTLKLGIFQTALLGRLRSALTTDHFNLLSRIPLTSFDSIPMTSFDSIPMTSFDGIAL